MTDRLTGGERLQAKLEEIARQIEKDFSLRVGFIDGATYPDEQGTTVAQAAWWLNYGTKTAPPRPFFTNLIAAKSDSWGDALARILESNDFDVENALQLMGEGISDQLKQALIDLASPALSPITLMLRKMRIDDPHLEITGKTVGEAARKVADGEDYGGASTKVGVYTGHMLNSITYKVES